MVFKNKVIIFMVIKYFMKRIMGCKICFVVSIGGLAIAGCTNLFIPPTNTVDIVAHNNQIFQIITQILAIVSTIIGFIGLWIKSNRDKQELEHKTELKAQLLAQEIQSNAESQEASLNKLQETLETGQKRGPARATDHKVIVTKD